jgi:hypothetical protein
MLDSRPLNVLPTAFPCCYALPSLKPRYNSAQTVFTPCQLGQLPSSKIPYGYPGPHAQNPQQTDAPCTNPSQL